MGRGSSEVSANLSGTRGSPTATQRQRARRGVVGAPRTSSALREPYRAACYLCTGRAFVAGMWERARIGTLGIAASLLLASAGDPPRRPVEVDIEIDGRSVHARSAGAEGSPGVLLLHGAAFHSGTWEELGTLERLSEAGYHVVAIDLPGFGGSKSVAADRETFLAELLPRLDLGRPVVVAPSMSGGFAFPLVASRPELVSGFVPVAPVAAPTWAARLKTSPVPALVVWGENDRVFPVAQAEPLARAFASARTLILKGARHPAYLDRPEAFHAALIEFLGEVYGEP